MYDLISLISVQSFQPSECLVDVLLSVPHRSGSDRCSSPSHLLTEPAAASQCLKVASGLLRIDRCVWVYVCVCVCVCVGVCVCVFVRDGTVTSNSYLIGSISEGQIWKAIRTNQHLEMARNQMMHVNT